MMPESAQSVMPAQTPSDATTVAVSAVVCTRSRGDSLVATVRSILANTHPNFELVVIDQSPNDDTANAIEPFLNDSRLRYIRSNTKGLGRARNLGLAQSRAEVAAMTDDDCEVPPDWLEKVESIFAANPKVAVAYYNVDAAPHGTEPGYTPDYQRKGDMLLRTVRETCIAQGIGAGMAVRRKVVLELGGFDEMLGAGARFPAHEEADISLRALLNGYEVYESDRTSVLHYGFRSMEQTRHLFRQYYLGTGAGHAKFLKCGRWSMLSVVSGVLWRTVFAPAFGAIIRLQKPRVLGRIVSYTKGFAQGWRVPVEKEKMLFRQPEMPEAARPRTTD